MFEKFHLPSAAGMAGIVAALAFLWTLHGDIVALHKDMRDLSDRQAAGFGEMADRIAGLEARVAKVEGLVEGLRAAAIAGARSAPAGPPAPAR